MPARSACHADSFCPRVLWLRFQRESVLIFDFLDAFERKAMKILALGENRNIAYRLMEGDAARPVLVFLHEGLGCTAMWKDFPERLCKMTGCPGLSYDRLGFGKSSPATGKRGILYLHESTLVELPQVLEALIPGREYILIGHSDGGSIALLHAAKRPALLRAAITEAAHVFVEDVTLSGIRKTVADYAEGKLAGLAKYHGDQAGAVFQAWAGTWLRKYFQYWNIEHILPGIEHPFFIIQGRQDQYATRAQVDKILAGLSGEKTSLFVENCGHTPHLQKKEKVLEIMAEYIEKQLRFSRAAHFLSLDQDPMLERISKEEDSLFSR